MAKLRLNVKHDDYEWKKIASAGETITVLDVTDQRNWQWTYEDTDPNTKTDKDLIIIPHAQSTIFLGLPAPHDMWWRLEKTEHVQPPGLEEQCYALRAIVE